MKKILIAIASMVTAFLLLFCGCSVLGRDGRDGRDGQDLTIEEVYNKYVEEYGDISYADFLKQYLNYTSSELDDYTDLQATINKSLMSAVSVIARFEYNSGGSGYTNRKTYSASAGSGVIIWLDKEKGDAYVVTNCHIVYDDTSATTYCQDIRLYLYGQDTGGVNYLVDSNYNITGDENYRIEAELVGASVSYDIALLKVTGSDVLKRSDAVASTFSTEKDVYIGEKVYTIGNANGEGIAASEGIISKDTEQIALNLKSDENDYGYYRVLRTTAPVNHGNSGGALYNTAGEIVGIVNSKDDTAESENLGYALPSNNVRRLIGLIYDNYVENGNKMLTNGGINKPRLNVVTKLSDSYAVLNKTTNRAEVYEVIEVSEIAGSPAFGNLKVGDVIKSVKLTDGDGKLVEEIEVTRNYYVSELMFSARAGYTVEFTVDRNGTEVKVPIVLRASDVDYYE